MQALLLQLERLITSNKESVTQLQPKIEADVETRTTLIKELNEQLNIIKLTKLIISAHRI